MGAICTKSNASSHLGPGGENNTIYLDNLDLPFDTPHPEVEEPEFRIQLKDFLRTDGYADINMGIYRGQKTIVHRLTKTALDPQQRNDFETEIRKYHVLSHPNVASIIGARVQAPGFCYVTTYFEKGSLSFLLKEDRITITQANKYKVMHQIALGMNYLHTQSIPIRHEDLRTVNIGVMNDWTTLVSDYGFSPLKALSRMQSLNQESAATTDPGLFLGNQISTKSDVYSFGVIMWEVWTRTTPFEGLNPLRIVHDSARGIRPPIPTNMPESYHKLMTDCWNTDASKRPDFTTVVEGFKTIIS